MVLGQLTTHILDTAAGRPAAGVQITLMRIGDDGRPQPPVLAEARSNDDGRCDGPLLQGDDFICGFYEVQFHIGAWFRAQAHGRDLPSPPFLDIIPIRFAVADATAHYHVPLLVSPFGYSTYRGS